jgi:hypothetical protein
MAPQVVRPRAVRGAALRSLCSALLRRHGELALVELHTLIHVYGYEILSRTPVKTLADSLGYETLEGRAERVRRGVYRAKGPAPSHIDPRLAGAPESWFPAFAAWQRGGPFSDGGADGLADSLAEENRVHEAFRSRPVARNIGLFGTAAVTPFASVSMGAD